MDANKIEDRGGQALAYLTDTDEKAADLKQEAQRAEARYETTLAAVFLVSEGNVETRKALSRRSPEAEQALSDYLAAQREYDAVANRRKSEAMVVDWCRSLLANRRQGG